MANWYTTKLGEIENKYGTILFNMAMTHLFNMGSNNLIDTTEEEIQKMIETEKKRQKDGKPYMMTPEFQGDIIRAAKEIAKCNFITEIIPYIKCHMSIEPIHKEIILYKEDFYDENIWQDLIYDLNLDNEETEQIELRVIAEG